jgi:hypothetical protein
MRPHIPLHRPVLLYITLSAAFLAVCEALKTREQFLAFLPDTSGVPVFKRIEKAGNESFVGDVEGPKDTVLRSKGRLGVRFVSERSWPDEKDEVRFKESRTDQSHLGTQIQRTAHQFISSNHTCGNPGHLALLDRGAYGPRQTLGDWSSLGARDSGQHARACCYYSI